MTLSPSFKRTTEHIRYTQLFLSYHFFPTGRVWFMDTSWQKSARGKFQQKNNFKHIQLTIYERKSNRKLHRDLQGIKFCTKSHLMWKWLYRELWPLAVHCQKELYLWRLSECPPSFFFFLAINKIFCQTRQWAQLKREQNPLINQAACSLQAEVLKVIRFLQTFDPRICSLYHRNEGHCTINKHKITFNLLAQPATVQIPIAGHGGCIWIENGASFMSGRKFQPCCIPLFPDLLTHSAAMVGFSGKMLRIQTRIIAFSSSEINLSHYFV